MPTIHQRFMTSVSRSLSMTRTKQDKKCISIPAITKTFTNHIQKTNLSSYTQVPRSYNMKHSLLEKSLGTAHLILSTLQHCRT
jgi:hypothetical protein